MNCPYCNKEIHAFTGLQEIQKFQKHLTKCKKYQALEDAKRLVTMNDALAIRAESGQ